MQAPARTGGATRAHLEDAARQGNAAAIAALQSAENSAVLPEPLEYLWERFEILDRLRGEGMHGPQPFTSQHIAATALLYGWPPFTRAELDALTVMDAVWRHPELAEEDGSDG